MGYAEDRRRDAYVAAHAWCTIGASESLDWQDLLDPGELLRWASNHPNIRPRLRRTY